MMQKNITKLHHANILLRGNRETVFEILSEHLNFQCQGNPDFLLASVETFGIDDARNLKRWAMGKPLVGENKVFLLTASSITIEAQNALLKTLEEPTPGTYIFLTLPSLNNLLPTLLSRVRVLHLNGSSEGSEGAENFLEADISKKLALIQNLNKKKESKTLMKDLIKDLEQVTQKSDTSYQNKKAILNAKILSTARGASPRMLLEWLTGVVQ